MIISIADMVEVVIIGLTFVADLQSAITIVIAKYSGYTVVVDGENQTVGEDFDADSLLARCAKHGAIARSVAPDFLVTLQENKPRAKIANRVTKLQGLVNETIAKLRAHDTKLCQPYDLDSLFVWSIEIDQLIVNDHITVEVSKARRTTSAPSVQGKTLGKGKGHRNSLWTCGTWPLTTGMFKGFTLNLTETMFTVTRDGEQYFAEPIADFSKVSTIARKCYDQMYPLVNENAEAPANPNVPRIWHMPLASDGAA